ncbi:MAG TPA: ABC transporter substrate-binding protein, partial [Microthrixaceae bacterium]|nr:ABC transporter substrate-binding protein [Microthrixaceae bacterium]
FESPVISLGDLAIALEAAATAFNERGGANGSCIEVHTCDDGANVDQSVACVRELDGAGIVATINDTTTAGNAEVAAALTEAGIPRVATNVSPSDWSAANAFALDASSTGSTLLMPKALIEEDITEIGVIRADLAQASALKGILESLYEDDGATFPMDAPVPSGTTDFSQFILKADEAGAEGIMLAVGEQEAIQIVDAATQLGSSLSVSATLGTFPYAAIADLDDFAEQMVFLSSFPPATYDLPVYEALRADLAASGDDALQPEEVKVTSMRSWIGLYALLRMIRDAGMTEFTRDGMTAMLQQAKDVPMLDMFGGENWTPDLNHPGAFQRAGINRWGVFRWDPEAESPVGGEGNFVEASSIDWDETVCGSPFGAPEPC